jgi:hypothetical protein
MGSVVRGLLVLGLVCTTSRLAAASCATDDPTGSKTAAARASADQMCASMGTGCDSGNHGAYVSCVAHVAGMLASGSNPSLPPSCKGAVILSAHVPMKPGGRTLPRPSKPQQRGRHVRVRSAVSPNAAARHPAQRRTAKRGGLPLTGGLASCPSAVREPRAIQCHRAMAVSAAVARIP